MKLFKISALAIAITALSLGANAQETRQGNWCKMDQVIQEHLANNPNALNELKQDRDAIMKNSSSNKKPFTYIIPVVVHNITHSGGQGYTSKSVIDAAINRLNIDFQRMNPDTTSTRALFKPYADGINIEFRLAHKDPNGNCTEGIVRLEHPSSADFSDSDKGISYWDSKKYFNIWLVDLINGSNPPSYIAGYAQFPYTALGGGINATYGVVIDNSFFGASNRTLTHEVGHCFGLLHTFQGNCGGNCSSSGDFICDTPPTSDGGFGCTTTSNTCSNDASGPSPYSSNVVDQFENYMSYSSCQNMFTQDQVATMVSILNNTSTSEGLDQLMTSGNLSFTGTADPYGPVTCAPIADFSYDKEYICEGDAVNFSDDSYNGTPTGWNWTFTGGTPNTSGVSNPSIVYNTAGVYSVTHTPSNSAGSDVITKTNIITVSSLTADYSAPFTDGFENNTTFNNEWRIENGVDGINWQNTNATAATGARCVRLFNYSASASTNDDDDLISPSYDLTTSSNKTMTFKLAFAQKTTADADRLFVYESINCGATWSLKAGFVGANLITAPTHPSVFTPTATEWIQKSVTLSNNPNVRVMFRFEGGGGNNVYLDDINIGGPVGVEEFSNIGNFVVYPNPSKSNAKISFNLLEDVSNLTIKIKNTLGQDVTSIINNQSFNAGKYTLDVDEQRKLSSGIYLIEFNADNNIKTEKLIIQ